MSRRATAARLPPSLSLCGCHYVAWPAASRCHQCQCWFSLAFVPMCKYLTIMCIAQWADNAVLAVPVDGLHRERRQADCDVLCAAFLRSRVTNPLTGVRNDR